MLNIVIPMAGKGSRFRDAGFDLPKPLIPIHGVPMVRLVIENLRPHISHRFIFLCLAEHLAAFSLKPKLREWAPGCVIISIDQVTDGAACTVLLAREFIDSQDPLMIANSDQWVDVKIDDYLATMETEGVDGLIMTMTADDPKWSFVRVNESGAIVEVVEKQVVSNEATVGIYNFRVGGDFVRAAERMIVKGERVNGEFYVAPTYNQLISEGAHIISYNVGHEGGGMYGLGIPADLWLFESMPISQHATLEIGYGSFL